MSLDSSQCTLWPATTTHPDKLDRHPESAQSAQMVGKMKRDQNNGGDDGDRPSLASAYPTIARWASGYGWVEFGIDGLDRPFVRALDEGGTVWEQEARTGTLDEALRDLECGLAQFLGEEFGDRPIPRAPRRPRKAEDGSTWPKKRVVPPALKKAETLGEIAAGLRRGEDFPVTRLTILKGLCEDRRAAGEFALFLIRKAKESLREKDAPKRYRSLVSRAVGEMKPYLAAPTDDRKGLLLDLLREMQSEQDESKNVAWGAVRLIESRDLLVAEKCLRAVLRPEEAPHWLYQAARDRCERYEPRYGTGLIPASAPMVKEVADFWRRFLGGR